MSVDPVMVGLVRDEMRRVTDRGELASRAMLRDAVGIGAGDLQAVLDELRDHGEASEIEPDGYRLVADGQLAEEDAALAAEVGPRLDAGLPAHVTVEEAKEAGWEDRRPLSAVQVGGYREEYSGAAQVTMPRAVADVLDAAALGALLKAGIDTATPGETFVFEVTP